MKKIVAIFLTALFFFFRSVTPIQASEKVFDIPTRPDVTLRLVYLAPENPKAAVILFAGGHGGLQISPSGEFT